MFDFRLFSLSSLYSIQSYRLQWKYKIDGTSASVLNYYDYYYWNIESQTHTHTRKQYLDFGCQLSPPIVDSPDELISDDGYW